MILAKLRKKSGKARYFEFLIDSGADYTLISQYDARLLGVEYKKIKQKEMQVEVANLAFIHAKKTTFVLNVAGMDIDIPVLVSKENVESLLGRRGLFNNFYILFRENEGEVVFITPGRC